MEMMAITTSSSINVKPPDDRKAPGSEEIEPAAGRRSGDHLMASRRAG
jgi:hypothetical protein